MDMEYVVLSRPFDVRIETCEIPEPGPGEVLLKTLFGGICGGDIAQYRGNFFLKKYPLIQGHEFSARIEKVDADNKYGLKEGMTVTGLPYYGCGTCRSCKRGFPQCCKDNETFGGFRDGAFRQYFVFPDWRVYDCKGLGAREAALTEPFVIGHHAAKRADIREGDRVLVIGAGTIGIVSAIMAKHYGGEVTICDVVQNKLDTAKNVFGIPHVLLNDDPDAFLDRVNDATGGDGYDIVMEAVGLPQTFRDSTEAVAIGGKVVSIGVGKKNLDFDFNIIQRKHLDILGTRNGLASDFKTTIDLAAEGKLGDIEKLITCVYPYREAAEAFDYADKHNDRVLKCLLRFAE
jgi:2-desacetyl-2-hydroxyethyl bacteriochlorophyllide A dehydrogenase